MKDQELTPEMVPVDQVGPPTEVQLREDRVVLQINQGRIADVMKGRRFPNIPAATSLPTDFPSA